MSKQCRIRADLRDVHQFISCQWMVGQYDKNTISQGDSAKVPKVRPGGV